MSTTTTDIDRYLDAVRAALADLPVQERDELLEDLPAHLADVAAESDGPLAERLGTPEEYAAELRASAGLGPRPAGRGSGRLARWRATVDRYRATLERRPAWRQFVTFLPELRPGWWVLRGVLAALVVTWILAYGSTLVFLLLAVAGVWASVWLGRRTPRLAPPARYAVHAVGVLLLWLALAGWRVASVAGDYEAVVGEGAVPVGTDVYVYDHQGRPLKDVQLFDQYGNPIDLGGPCQSVRWQRTDGSVATNVYPRRFVPGEYEHCEAGRPAASVPALLPQPEPGDGSATVGAPTPTPTPTVATPAGTPPAPGPSPASDPPGPSPDR